MEAKSTIRSAIVGVAPALSGLYPLWLAEQLRAAGSDMAEIDRITDVLVDLGFVWPRKMDRTA